MFSSTQFVIEQNKQITVSPFGSVLGCRSTITFVIGLFFIVGCWLFGDQLFNRLNPSVIFSERYVEQAQKINTTNDNFIIMIGVSSKQSELWVDPTIFQVRAVQQILQITNNSLNGYHERRLISVNKTMKICDQSDIGIPEDQDLNMEGDFNAQQFAQLYVYIDKCQYSTSEVLLKSAICQPLDVINQKLQLTNIDMYFSNMILDPLNQSHPFTFKGMNQYSSASSVFPKELQLYYANCYIQDDIGLLNTQKEEKHKFLFTNKQETTYFGDHNVLARVLIRIQKMKESLQKIRYQNIQDVIAHQMIKSLNQFRKVQIKLKSSWMYFFQQISYRKQKNSNQFCWKKTKQNYSILFQNKQLQLLLKIKILSALIICKKLRLIQKNNLLESIRDLKLIQLKQKLIK
ncbi:hypothetical protein ABPG72_017101 [Tetrahymena utriculariae]